MNKQDDKQQKQEEKDKKEKTEEKVEEQQEVVSKEEYDAVKEVASQHENNYKRAVADYQNLQKRVTLERQDWIKIANKELLLRLLPVLDTLMLASKHVEDQGLKVSVNMFLDTLKSEGIVRLKTIGEKFDPETMECIQIEDGEDGKVIEELRAGYMIHDKLLRPAQVKVGKKEEK
jgi:molecular chaperone GrpE